MGNASGKKDQILNAARLLELVNTEAGGENVDGITFEVEVLKFATSFFIADTPTAREEKALRRLEVLSMPTQRRRGSMIATTFKRTGSGRHYTVGNEAARFKDSFGQKNAPIISMNAATQAIEHKRTNAKARALFGLLDKNQNGLLELEELVGALNLNEEDSQRLFKEADSNNDGTIDLNEFLTAFVSAQTSLSGIQWPLNALYDEFDVDKSGGVNHEQFVAKADVLGLSKRKLKVCSMTCSTMMIFTLRTRKKASLGKISLTTFSQADIDFECIRWPAGATCVGVVPVVNEPAATEYRKNHDADATAADTEDREKHEVDATAADGTSQKSNDFWVNALYRRKAPARSRSCCAAKEGVDLYIADIPAGQSIDDVVFGAIKGGQRFSCVRYKKLW